MPNFIIDGIYSLYNSFRLRLWPNEVLKRRRDSADEDEEVNVLAGCQKLSKRPKWMTSAYTSNMKMASDGRPTQHSRLTKTSSKGPNKKSFQHRFNEKVKENEPDVIEVIDVEDDNYSSVESRPPLSNLAVRTKAKCLSSDNGIASQPPHRNHVQDRKQNGVRPMFSTFTSPVRTSKNSIPKQIALNETFKMDERLKYSQLLADYHKSSRTTCTIVENHQTRQNWSMVNDVLKPVQSPKSVPFIEDRKRTHITVKPWEEAASSSDDEVKIIEERTVPRVNSLEKRLSQSSLVSSQWIADMKQKYSERERETMRQVQEAKIRKELYAKHNQLKLTEALNERIQRHLKITDIVFDETELESKLPEITPAMKGKIDSALKPNPSNEALVEGFGQRITRHDIQTLNKLNWLNDEVINFYLNLLIERGKKEKNPRIYAFNTFFYPKLISQGYNSLKRWTKKVDIFEQDLLLVPIHLGMHWCMATIDFRNQTVCYYDSMGSENNRCLNALLQYLTDESLDKKKKPYDISGWTLENVKDIPQQMNGSDCGMFSCMFAEYLSRNAKITFSQKDMPYFRQKMVYEIITKNLLQ